MAFTQQTFLGASIRFFNASIEWGNTASTLTVGLVEDPKNSDEFAPPKLGTPVYFEYIGGKNPDGSDFVWKFGGILQSWKLRGGGDGNPVYEVALTDAKDVLNGTQLILDGYFSSTSGFPNLLNVFGYWENISFGNSLRNRAGIPWQKVRDGVLNLLNKDNLNFGDKITLNDNQYSLDLSELPEIDANYRITAKNQSLLDFIVEITEVANRDMFLQLLDEAEVLIGRQFFTLKNVIKVKTIDRNIRPEFGKITDFITSSTGAESKEAGFEFRNEEIGKFVVGGNLLNMYLAGNRIFEPLVGENGAEATVSFFVLPSSSAIFVLDASQLEVGDIIKINDEEMRVDDILPISNLIEVTRGYHGTGLGHHKKGDKVFLQTTDEDDANTALKNNPENNIVWPFWGFDRKGDVVLGKGTGDEHGFSLDARFIDIPGVKDTYPTDVGEMRAAADSQESWEFYLWTHNFNEFRFDNEGDEESELKDPITEKALTVNGKPINYKHKKGDKNPHFGKASEINIPGMAAETLIAFMYGADLNQIESLTANLFLGYTKKQINLSSKGNKKDNETYDIVTRLYKYVRDFSDEFYAKKYMVRLPFLFVKLDDDTKERVFSMQPENAGFLNEYLWDDAISLNFLPEDINRLTLEDGRIEAYVRFDNFQELDLSQISADDIIYGSFSPFHEPDGDDSPDDEKKSVFIKVQVEEDIVFLNQSDSEKDDFLSSPRAIVTFPGPIYKKPKDGTEDQLDDKIKHNGLTIQLLLGGMTSDSRSNPATKSQAKDIINKLLTRSASDNILFNKEGQFKIPDIAAVPLKSNVHTYGPWSNFGASGNVEFEQDESLVPWNYGGYTGLNNAGLAKVNDISSNFQEYENGSINIPEVPSVQLGSQLIEGGPYLTDIKVNIDANNSASTSYGMNTWTPKPYRLRKSLSDRFTKFSIENQKARRDFREESKREGTAKAIAKQKQTKIIPKNPKEKQSSSHTIIAADSVPDGSGGYRSSTAIQPYYNFMSQIDESGYRFKAGVSLDAIFRPFSTDSLASGIPRYELPSGNATTPTISDLDNFNHTMDFDIAVHDSGIFKTQIPDLPDDLRIPFNSGLNSGTEFRSIGLRAPLMLVGWGFDTGGKPVPNKSGTTGQSDDFIDDYQKRMDLWKVGPLDAKWDHQRKVWATGGSNTKLVKIIEGSGYPSGVGQFVYKATEFEIEFTDVEGTGVTLTSKGNTVFVGNFRSNVVLPNTFYTAYEIGNKFVLDNQATFIEFQ